MPEIGILFLLLKLSEGSALKGKAVPRASVPLSMFRVPAQPAHP